MKTSKPLVFDGHNDLLSKIFSEGGIAKAASFYKGRKGAIDLQKAQVGGFGGGFFAVYVPSQFDLESSYQEMERLNIVCRFRILLNGVKRLVLLHLR